MAENWDAVGQAITNRLAEVQMTQLELAGASGVSPATIREIQYNKLARRRSPRTLAALSEALSWPANYLSQVLAGEIAQPHPDESADPLLKEITAVHDELRDLRERVAQLEDRLSGESS